MAEKDTVAVANGQENKEVKFFEAPVQPKPARTTRVKSEEKPEQESVPEVKSEPVAKVTSIEFEDTDIFKKIKSDYKLESVYENVTAQNQPRFAMGDMILIFKKK